MFKDHLDGFDRQKIGERTVGGRYIGFHCMSQSVHTGIGNQRLRHRATIAGSNMATSGMISKSANGYLIPLRNP